MNERGPPKPPSLLGRATELIYGSTALRATGRLRRPLRSILVVAPPQSPTFDYYLAPRFSPRSSVKVERAELRNPPSRWLNDDTKDGAFVLFCRYASADWLNAVENHGAKLAGVGLFIDDDIPGLVAEGTAPLFYRTRLVLNHLRYRRRLTSILDFVFVSTETLAERESLAHPIVVNPAPSLGDTPLPRASPKELRQLRVAFHSTASHAAEHAWLAPVLRDLSARFCDATIDVYANRVTRRYWRGIERIDIRPALAWNDYRLETRARGADLLLAPQLPSAVNAVRAPTKRIDAFRMGAALITNATGVYSASDEEAELGMILPLEPDAWIEGLSSLLQDPPRIAQLAHLNALHVGRWEPAPITQLNPS